MEAFQNELWPWARRLAQEYVQPAIDSIVAGPKWKWKSLLAVFVLSLFHAFPSYDALSTEYDLGTWRNAAVKFSNPMADTGRIFPPQSHESMATFRLTVPIVAHLLRLQRTGVLIFTALVGMVMLYAALSLGANLTGSRVAALFIALAIACNWPGETAFHELRGGYYDAVALCFLVLAMAARSPLLTGFCVFLAAWTDERALIASCLVFLFAVACADRLLASRPVAVVLSWAGYFAARWWVAHAYSLTQGTRTIGLATFMGQLNMLPLGIWTGLGGGWLIVVCGSVALFLQRRFVLASAFLGALVLMVVVSFSVYDTTRSMAFCLPALFLGTSALRRSESARTVEILAILAGTISLLCPAYQAQGSTGLWWLFPLPAQLIRWAAGIPL